MYELHADTNLMTPKNEFVLSVVSFQEPDLFSKWPQVIEPKIWATEIRAFPSKDGLYEQEVTDQKFQEHVRNEIFEIAYHLYLLLRSVGTSIQAQEIVFAQVTYHPNDSETWVTNSGLNFSPAGLLHYYFMQIQKDEGVYTMKDTSVGDTHYEAPPKI